MTDLREMPAPVVELRQVLQMQAEKEQNPRYSVYSLSYSKCQDEEMKH